MTKEKSGRDYALAREVSTLSNKFLVGPSEVAAITGFAKRSIGDHKRLGLPPPIAGLRVKRWELGAILDWIRSQSGTARATSGRTEAGRQVLPGNAEASL